MLRIEVDGHFHGSSDVPKPWVARIDGPDARYGLKREFVKPMQDWAKARAAWSGNTYGVVSTFPMRDGLYEVSRLKGRSSKRYVAREFMRIVGGKRQPVERSEVLDVIEPVDGGVELELRDGDGPISVGHVTGLGMPRLLGWVLSGKERRHYQLGEGRVYEVIEGERRRLVGVRDGSTSKLSQQEAWEWLR